MGRAHFTEKYTELKKNSVVQRTQALKVL